MRKVVAHNFSRPRAECQPHNRSTAIVPRARKPAQKTFPLDSTAPSSAAFNRFKSAFPVPRPLSQENTMSHRARLVAVASLLFALIAFPSASPAANNAFVRINQLGYLTGSPARAYLMSKGTETGATFEVLNAKGIALSTAPIGASLGVWGNFNVFALDFTPAAAGTFTIEVNGPMPATSPAFPVGTAKQLYAQALANTLYFYQNE